MKYTIEGFSQEVALNMKKEITVGEGENQKIKILKLDVIDLMLLRWFVDFYPKMKKIIVGQTQYAWVNYQAIVDGLPLLGMEKTPVYRRFKKMCELGILTHHHCKDGGSFSYYGFGEAYASLIDTPPTIQKSEGYDSKVIPPTIQKSDPLRFKSSTKDSSINNNSSISYHSSFSILQDETQTQTPTLTEDDYLDYGNMPTTVANEIKKIPDIIIREKILVLAKNRLTNLRPLTVGVIKANINRLEEYSCGDTSKKIKLLDIAIEYGYDMVQRPFDDMGL
jgi:hypothetical protein